VATNGGFRPSDGPGPVERVSADYQEVPGVRILNTVQAGLLAAAVAGAALLSSAPDWQPLALVAVLATVAIASDSLAIEARGLRLSGSFISIVLAMALLGPAPAVAIGLATIVVDSVRTRLPLALLLANATAYAVFPLAGALVVSALHLGKDGTIGFGLEVFIAFAVGNFVNFLLVAGPRWVTHGESLARNLRKHFVPMLPSEGMAGALAVAIAIVYQLVGIEALVALVGVLVLFQVLTRELLISQQRAEQLEARTTQLGSLQVGVLAALVQTLALRDRMTARHSAAVARYAKAIAAEIGCGPEEQELVHTAGLLHDIGKFVFPDHILLSNRKLDDEDWAIVKLHPEHGARLVRRLDGYGPVADIILAHHERIDGRGYPAGLIGEEVPLLSRMLSVADTYDVMTARDSYRDPVSQAEAIAELRRVSGAQLDGRLVEAFVRVLERRGLAFQHTTDADFEAELAFDRRVRSFALAA
jgi:putative nucleotidyltransferase with HDIG domain